MNRVLKAPIVCGRVKDARQRDIAVVFGDVMVDKQRQHVADVLVVDADNLELGHQQVGKRDREAVSRDALAQIEFVGHREAVEQDVDRPSAGGVMEIQSGGAVQRVEHPIGFVPLLFHEGGDQLAVSAPADEVSVAVIAAQRWDPRAGARAPDRDTAEQPQRQLLRVRRGRQSLPFLSDVLQDLSH